MFERFETRTGRGTLADSVIQIGILMAKTTETKAPKAKAKTSTATSKTKTRPNRPSRAVRKPPRLVRRVNPVSSAVGIIPLVPNMATCN